MPKTALCCCSGTVSQTEPAYSLGHGPSPRSKSTLTDILPAVIQPYAVLLCHLKWSPPPVNHVNVNTWITIRLPTQKGWKAELADPWRTVYPQSGHLSTTDRLTIDVTTESRCHLSAQRASASPNKSSKSTLISRRVSSATW